ncbi:hypothetical protein PMZ80_000971 [Knufia obscura]|uniref:DUF159 domain protein n=2 Tax=Knufia TaxID=430999 RepID=A0AAN8EI94_9EURO|nr:hypothetical protein PMZ80_000971 [Knufia obscura]KAK5950235.1 hypothetical protein OHC33_008703 [Knufia fluminis]
MCGRYALGIRASFVRYQLQQQGMQVDNAPEDDEARETYNFPPGAYGLVYRAEVPDSGLRDDEETPAEVNEQTDAPTAVQEDRTGEDETSQEDQATGDKKHFNYEIKVMKWGLIPFWTKRSPDYGSMMRTINCRDDSLIENRGMWNTMKQRKRCIVVAQGFYEWLKKGPGGKEKVPHFVKRKDGQLMCFAGLWDCVKYEDAEEKLYTYTIITTDSNKQLNFLHDRMPVILDPDTDAMKLWLDPTVNKWSKELQSLLKPFEGELECYPVNKDVGKVGNNSPDFIIPVDSKENKKNIANFFGNAQKKNDLKHSSQENKEVKVERNQDIRKTEDHNGSENSAPMPVPPKSDGGMKRKADLDDEGEHVEKAPKLEFNPDDKPSLQQPATPDKAPSPPKRTTAKKTRSATSNADVSKKPSPAKADGSKRITSFFGKT